MRQPLLAFTSALALAALAAWGCSAAGDPAAGDGSGAGAGGGDSGGTGGSIFTGTGTGSSSGAAGCTEQAKLIYVLSDANELYSFDPPSKHFQLIGALGCNTTMSPNSVAVDRNAVAWVNYVASDGFGDTGGAIFKVSTSDASCEAAAAVSLPPGWFRMGMGYSTNGADTTDETLFVAGIGDLGGGTGLGMIQNGALVNVAPFGAPLAGQNGELTGNAEGRLFGFFTTAPVQVAEIDKATGGIVSTTPLPTVELPSAWAFSFWGGDFYLYTASLGTSNVTRYRPIDQSVDTAYMTNIGFRIVGAGVSTCAPLTPPS